MPSDDFEDKEELGPLAGRTGDGPGRKRRQDSDQGFAANWRQKAAGKQTGSRDPNLNDDTGNLPTTRTLPTGTAHQVELLLAKRQRRTQGLLIRLGLFVVLPTIVVWFYTALIATPRYVCKSELTYQAYVPATSLSGGLVQSDAGSTVTDYIDYGTLLYEFIRSGDLAQKVDQQIDLRGHFSSSKIDSLSRLGSNATQAQFLAYWKDHVSVSEGFGGYITVEVQGFDPAFTLLLAETINTDANAMIDGLNNQARTSEVNSARTQVRLAAAALNKANDALTLFRNSHGDLDPSYAATLLATIIGDLESNLASLQAQLQQAEANMQPGASQIVQLKLQVSALQQQIVSERQRLSDTTAVSYSDTVSQYNDLLSDQQFANTNYQAATQGLIISQADAAAKQNYSVDFVAPILPDRPTAPDPFTNSFTTFAIFLSLYGICNLLFAAFRDQSGI